MAQTSSYPYLAVALAAELGPFAVGLSTGWMTSVEGAVVDKRSRQ